MNHAERELVREIHETSGEWLKATNNAEEYLARRKLIVALNNLDAWIAETYDRLKGSNATI